MELSNFFAQLWGLFLLLSVGALLYDESNLKHMMKLAKDDTFLMLTGYLALIMGLVTVLLHNVWELSWVGLVTLFGWAALVKGVTRLYSPKTVEKSLKWIKNSKYLQQMLYVSLVLGMYLTIMGFVG